MAIKGSLKEASLPDVIQLLALGRKTGCLAVTDRQNFGAIYFEDGRIIYASIVNRRDRLGDLLVSSGKLTEDQLRQAVAMQSASRDRKLGEILVTAGFISRGELEAYMRLQIEEAVYALFTWTSGTFNFEPGVRPEGEDVTVSINPESLLLEGARRIDEWELIAKKIPSLDVIFSLDAEKLAQAGVVLSPEQERIVPLVDGRRDVQQIMDESGLVEFEAAKALYGLITAGFAQRTGSSAAAAMPRVTDARVEEHRNLGVAFYRTGMLDEAQREFRRVADLRPAEGAAAFYLGLIALRQGRWNDAVDALRSAAEKGGPRPAVLHNLALALGRLGRLQEAEAAHAEAVARLKDDPRVLVGWGICAIRRGDFGAARARLERARELYGGAAPPPLWWWAAVIAAAGAGDLDAALELATAAVEAHPGDAVLANNLAVLQELTGNLSQAESLLRGALTLNPALPQLSKNLGDIAYRGGRYDEAFEAYERAAKLAPDLGDDLFFKLGNLAFKRGDRQRARASWERALALNPSHQLAQANLGMLDAAPA
ncbi:MAG: DUF4388 domain-containing protein [Gemmatimonadota bacterium]